MEKRSQINNLKNNQDLCLILIPNFITAVYKIACTNDRFPHTNRFDLTDNTSVSMLLTLLSTSIDKTTFNSSILYLRASTPLNSDFFNVGKYCLLYRTNDRMHGTTILTPNELYVCKCSCSVSLLPTIRRGTSSSKATTSLRSSQSCYTVKPGNCLVEYVALQSVMLCFSKGMPLWLPENILVAYVSR
jgi:hypothetical protein